MTQSAAMESATRGRNSGADLASEADLRRLASGMELFGAAVATALAFAAVAAGAGPYGIALNILTPTVLGLALAYGTLRTVVDHPLAAWLPSFWFRISAGAFFALGALAPYLVDARAAVYLQGFARLDAATVAKVNLATTMGIALVVACLFATRILRPSASRVIEAFDGPGARLLTGVCLVVGGVIRYGVAIPQTLNVVELRSLLPIVPFAFLFQLGLLMLLIQGLNRRGWLLIAVIALLVADTAISSLSLMKIDVIANLVLAFTASMTVKCTVRRFLVWSAVLALSFFLITGVIDNARMIGESLYQTGQQYEHWGSPLARLDEIYQALFSTTDNRQFDRIQSLLVRLCYTPIIAAAMDFGDGGVPFIGDGFWLWSAVPRLLYPAKPIIGFGGTFYTMLSGKDYTWMSPTFFGDAYWQGGWPGVVFWLTAYGAVLAGWSFFTNLTIGSGRTLYLPVAFLGMRFAIAHYGFLVSHFTALLSQGVYLAAGLWILGAFWAVWLAPRLRSRRLGSHP